VDRKAIARAVIDALILRQEMRSHDLTHAERVALMAAAMSAFITWEAARDDGA
jgi:HD superfamily phosphodiesterase